MTTSQPQPKHESDHELDHDNQQAYHRDHDPADSDSTGAERARRRDDVLWRLSQLRQRSKTNSRNTVRLPAGIDKRRQRKTRSGDTTS